MNRDDLVRASADWAIEYYGLDMQRLRGGGRTDTAIRSAINGLIRVGRLERHGAQLLRRGAARSSIAPERDAEARGQAESADASPISAKATGDDQPSVASLRALVGDVPGESEAAFMQLLATPLKAPAELHAAVAHHLEAFEKAFEVHQFLDMTGAEKLAASSRRLLEIWPTLTREERHLAQAAILYFVESDEADDDFRIGGLRTDKLVMEAVNRAVFRERSAL